MMEKVALSFFVPFEMVILFLLGDRIIETGNIWILSLLNIPIALSIIDIYKTYKI
jgi:hypothetical protein